MHHITSHQATRVFTTTHIFIHFHCINQQFGYYFWHGHVSTDQESIEVKKLDKIASGINKLESGILEL